MWGEQDGAVSHQFQHGYLRAGDALVLVAEANQVCFSALLSEPCPQCPTPETLSWSTVLVWLTKTGFLVWARLGLFSAVDALLSTPPKRPCVTASSSVLLCFPDLFSC